MNTRPTATSRKATNVTIDAELLQRAKTLGINISKASEDGLARAISARQSAIWLQDNEAALESSNAFIDRQGLPLAKHRNF